MNVKSLCEKCKNELYKDSLLTIDEVRAMKGKCDKCGEKRILQVIMWCCDKCDKTYGLHGTACKKHKITPVFH